MPIDEKKVRPYQYIKRKLHNLTHPKLGKILMLHRVVENRSEGRNAELEVTPDFLRLTIENQLREGCRFVSIDQVCDILAGKDKGRPFVCLTFDDGYRDNFTVALPLLKSMGIPFAIYVTTDFLDGKRGMWWYNDHKLGLSSDELKALDKDPLCTIGAHTLSHPRLDSLNQEDQYREIAQSKENLEIVLGHPIRHFSYPHGAYNDTTIEIVNNLHFTSSVCAWGGFVRHGTSLLLLPRIELRQI